MRKYLATDFADENTIVLNLFLSVKCVAKFVIVSTTSPYILTAEKVRIFPWPTNAAMTSII